MATSKKPHVVEVLEKDFHIIQNKIVKAKDKYLATHQKEHAQAKRAVAAAQRKLASAKKQTAKAAVAAKKSSSKAAQNQLKKARAAATIISASLGEARDLMKDK